MQVNNQLFGTVHPIMLYVPAASDDDDDGGTEPALQISTRKMPSGKWDAYLFRVRTQTMWHLMSLSLGDISVRGDMNVCFVTLFLAIEACAL